jgi:hypothetical protein
VEAMILHSASMTAIFVDQLAQVPVVVQCASAAPESPWKWIIQSVIPVAGGTLIAVWSFVQNRHSEQKQWERNQKAALEQWNREQRKSEWSQLLRSIAEVERVLRMGSTVNRERIQLIIEDLKPAIHEVVQAQVNCIFLLDFFTDRENYKKFFSFLEKAEKVSEEVDGWQHVVRDPLPGTKEQMEQEKSRNLMRVLELCHEITSEYFDFQRWLRQQAAQDLAVVESLKQ